MDFENCKCEDQFPFAQPQNASVVPIPMQPPFIDFGLNVLATGQVDCRANNLDFCCHATIKLFVFNRV